MRGACRRVEAPGVSRGEFALFCAGIAGTFALPVGEPENRRCFEPREEANPRLAGVPGLPRQQRVEGSIPPGAGGAYCTIGGKSTLSIAREVCGGAAATIAMGSCATYGGLPAAAPNPTGALGVADAVRGVKNLTNLSACPANAANMVALISYYLTFKHWPPVDRVGKPLFAYGQSIHDACERRAHFDTGQYVEAWATRGTGPATVC